MEDSPRAAPQILGVVLRCEESIGKIQGVLTDKVQHLGTVTHELKIYDFTDKTPAHGATIEGNISDVDLVVGDEVRDLLQLKEADEAIVRDLKAGAPLRPDHEDIPDEVLYPSKIRNKRVSETIFNPDSKDIDIEFY